MASGRAVVIGAGLTGVAVRRHFEEQGYEVVVLDDAAGPVAESEVDRVVASADLVYPSAGVKPYHAAWRAARAHGVRIVGELDLAQELAKVPVVAITASNGKTTIATLVTQMLAAAGMRSVAAGNIGFPLIDAVKTDAEVIVAEVSSFQLYAANEFRPSVALWANASPNHLDWHGTVEEYVAAKARIFQNQTPDDTAVANAADPVVMEAATSSWARVVTFGPGGAFTRIDDELGYRDAPDGPFKRILLADELPRALPHDVDNALAALATAHAAGAALDSCAEALRSFTGVPHRLELVGEAGGVRWLDDSSATTPESVLAALNGFESVVLIAGGRNKGTDLSLLAQKADRVRAVIAIGEAAPEIDAAFRSHTAVATAESMDDAVTRAACLARSGDVVILSPGCASFDWYSSYVERGEDFSRAVREVLSRTSDAQLSDGTSA